jgi:hypothetical protein
MALPPQHKRHTCYCLEKPLDPGSEAGITEHVVGMVPVNESTAQIVSDKSP